MMNEKARYKYDIFISYRDDEKEEEWVKTWVSTWLLPRLENADFTVCIRSRDFAVGVPELTNTERAVTSSRHVLLVLTPAWAKSGLALFEDLIAQSKDPAGLRQRTLPIRLQPCEDLPERITTLTPADFTHQDKWEDQLNRLMRAMKVDSEPDLSKDSEPKIIPTIHPQGEPSPYALQLLRTLAYNGTLGKLFQDDMRNEDILEAYFIGQQESGSLNIWLNLNKIPRASVYRVGWMTKFETKNCKEYIPMSSSTVSPIGFLPYLSETMEPDVAKLEISLLRPTQLITFAEFLQHQACDRVNTSLEATLRNWVEQVFDDLEELSRTKPKIVEQSINYAQLYAPRLADFVLHVEEIDTNRLILGEYIPGQATESSISDKAPSTPGGTLSDGATRSKAPTDSQELVPFREVLKSSVECCGPNFLVRIPMLASLKQGGYSLVSTAILTPTDEQMIKQLVDIVDSNRVVMLGDIPEKNKAKRRRVRLQEIFDDAFQSQDTIKFDEIKKKQPRPAWRHFGYLAERKMLYGLAHGNLRLENMMVAQENDETPGNSESSDLWSVDYQYLGKHYPLIKDHASLEASIWFDVVFKEFENLEEIVEFFIRLLCVTSVFQFDAGISDDGYKQAVAGMLLIIRQRAWDLYRNALPDWDWWLSYAELLYHELLLYSESHDIGDKIGREDRSSRLVKLYLLLSFLSDLIDEWHDCNKDDHCINWEVDYVEITQQNVQGL